jgi:hypothetical protein
MRRLVLRNLGFVPRVIAIRLELGELHPLRRIDGDPLARLGECHERAQSLEPIALVARRHGGEQQHDELLGQEQQWLVAVSATEAFQHRAVLILRTLRQPLELGALEIGGDRRTNRARLATARANIVGHACDCQPIGHHELIGTGQARQAHARESGAAEVVINAPGLLIDEGLNVLQFDSGHFCLLSFSIS